MKCDPGMTQLYCRVSEWLMLNTKWLEQVTFGAQDVVHFELRPSRLVRFW